MYRLTVCYGHPKDPAAFDDHYRSTHRRLAERIPGLRGLQVAACSSIDPGSPPPFHLVAQLEFDDLDALGAGLASPQGQAATEDAATFADGGITVFVQHDLS